MINDQERDSEGYIADFQPGQEVVVLLDYWYKYFGIVKQQHLATINDIEYWDTVSVEIDNGVVIEVDRKDVLKVVGYCPSCSAAILEMNHSGQNKENVQIPHNGECILT